MYNTSAERSEMRAFTNDLRRKRRRQGTLKMAMWQ
jgi:hypothetical protein